MKIRTRLAVWYSCSVLVSLVLMLAVLYYELIIERRSGGRREDTTEQIVDILLFYGVPTAFFLVVGGWWFMRKAMAPLTNLTRAVERVHADNLGERLPAVGSGDELDRLSAVFNDMMVRLEGSFERVRDFSLHASHELKTPLTVMRGEVETLLRDSESTPVQREALAGHLDEIQRLTQIVDRLLLLAKADAGLVTLALEPVQIDELVREAYEDSCILGEPQRLTVELGSCEKAIVRGDRHRLRQLLLNLADNAAKYNQPDGRVTLALGRDGRQAVITITNNGPGLAPEQIPRLFEPFYRGHGAQAQRVEGSGLGLSIAQWIATSHGGTISINSKPNEPTVVTVRLPLES